MSTRVEQSAAEIRRVVQERLTRGLNDPRVRGLVSVTEVRLSSDMADATVMVSVLPQEHETLTLHGLRHAAGHLQSSLARTMRVRRVPRLSFKIDHGLKRQAAVDAACVAARRNEQPPSSVAGNAAGGIPEEARNDADS